MAFKKKGTEEEVKLKSPEEPKEVKEESSEDEKEKLTYEEVLVNHEKRIAHLESVLIQLRNSI